MGKPQDAAIVVHQKIVDGLVFVLADDRAFADDVAVYPHVAPTLYVFRILMLLKS
ncbi:MAG: hypothetical protein ACYCQL_00610 [Acidithiobacillus sp.]